MHEHISPLLAEHPRIVNIFWGPVTVHYREVSLYNIKIQWYITMVISIFKSNLHKHGTQNKIVRPVSNKQSTVQTDDAHTLFQLHYILFLRWSAL